VSSGLVGWRRFSSGVVGCRRLASAFGGRRRLEARPNRPVERSADLPGPARSLSSRERPRVGAILNYDDRPAGSAREVGHRLERGYSGHRLGMWLWVSGDLPSRGQRPIFTQSASELHAPATGLHTKQRGTEYVPVETRGYRSNRVSGGVVGLETVGRGLVAGVPENTLVSRGVRFEWKRRSCRLSSKFSGEFQARVAGSRWVPPTPSFRVER
jgi:hypothetical protein